MRTGYDALAGGIPGRAFCAGSTPAPPTIGEPGRPAARRGGVLGVQPPVTLPSESESPELDDDDRPEEDSLTARRVGVDAGRCWRPGRRGYAGRGLSTIDSPQLSDADPAAAGDEEFVKQADGAAPTVLPTSIVRLSDLSVGTTELVAARPGRRARR